MTLPNYRYIASYPRFYPDKRDGNGQSLSAVTGVVVEWEAAPSTAEWAETDEAVTWGIQAAPEPPQDPAPAPVAPAGPVPPAVSTEPPEAVPAPVADPQDEGPKPFVFPPVSA